MLGHTKAEVALVIRLFWTSSKAGFFSPSFSSLTCDMILQKLSLLVVCETFDVKGFCQAFDVRFFVWWVGWLVLFSFWKLRWRAFKKWNASPGLLENVNQSSIFSFLVTHCCWTLDSLILEPSWFMCLSTVWEGIKPLTVMAWDLQQHTITSSTLVNYTVSGAIPLSLNCPQNCRTAPGSVLPEMAAIFPNNSIVWSGNRHSLHNVSNR